jgi:putative ABC transport system permease protein
MSGGIFLLVRRSLRQHAFSTCATLFAVALSAGLVMSVFAIQHQTRQAFTGGNMGFDAVLGARGSQLQLVLNAVFHLETSPGNIPWSLYQTIKAEPMVKLAVPYATGDNYRGFRIVGTTGEIFSDFEIRDGEKLQVVPGGRVFNPDYREAVLGNFVAQSLGLKIGDVINPYHGLVYDESAKHNEEYTVVGILETTNTPMDRVVWIPIEGIYRMEGHVLRGTGEVYTATAGQSISDEHKEVSAVMIKFREGKGGSASGSMAGFNLSQTINQQGKVATLAFPVAVVMADLFNKIGWINRVFEMVAYLVVVVSVAAIMASIYNTINERRREFAILRALGARRRTVLASIVLESTTIAVLGAIAGYVVYGTVLGVAAYVLRQQTGVVLAVFQFHPVLIATPVGMALLGAIAGLVPAYKAYSTDVAENLVPHS